MHVTLGTVIAGKYRVDEVLGEGGMGVVMRAIHMVLNEPVAVKLLRPELTSEPAASERFLREAKAAMRIRGQHIAQVLDAGLLDSGVPYIVMEYLRGQDLAAMLEARGPLPVTEAVDAVLQACRGLHGAHDAGVVHRDVKPANLFATTTTEGKRLIKLLDFGISKLHGDDIERLTKSNAMMGSALYMSPEQLISPRDVDHRTDIYALGVTLYELLSADFPYKGETIPQLVAQVLNGTAQPLRSSRSDLPPGLGAVVARAIARVPAKRHPTITALATSLAPFASAGARRQLDDFLFLAEGTLGAVARRDAPPATVPGAPIRDEQGAAQSSLAEATGTLVPSEGANGPPSNLHVPPFRVAIATSFSPMTVMPRLSAMCEALGRELSQPVSAHLMVSYDEFVVGAEMDAFHVLWLPPMVALSLVPQGIVQPVAVPVRHGMTSYAAALFTRPESELSTLADLRGKTAGWADVQSSAGYMLPRAMLTKAGIDPDEDLAGQGLLGSHNRVVNAVLSGRIDFGATYVNLREGAAGEATITRAGWGSREVRVIARSNSIPNDLLAVGRALDAAMVDDVRSALLRSESPLFERLCELLQCDGFVAPKPSHLAGLSELA